MDNRNALKEEVNSEMAGTPFFPDPGEPFLPYPGTGIDPMQPLTPTPDPLPFPPIQEPGQAGRDLADAAVIFGQSEEEMAKEFKAFKASKLFRKFDCDLTAISSVDDFEEGMAEVTSFGFGSAVLTPQWVARAKAKLIRDKLADDIKVGAVVCYPYGEEMDGVKAYAAKKAINEGADFIYVPCGRAKIRRGRTDELAREFKKIRKFNKKVKVFAVLECDILTETEIEKAVKSLRKVGIENFVTASGAFGVKEPYKGVKAIRQSGGSGLCVSCYTFAKRGEEVVGLLGSADRVLIKNAVLVANDLRDNLKY